MPTIAVNLGAVVSSFSDLPFGSYLGEIVRIKLLAPRQAGKFAQLIVTYLVIDGDHTGQKQSQFLSLSPNAMGFVKDFFSKFGLGELPELVIDDDTEELTEPDLYGSKVIFKVSPDSKDKERTRVSLTSVEETTADEAVAPVRSTVKPPKAAEDVEAVVDRAAERAAARAAAKAAAQAALDALEDDDDEDAEEAVEVVAKPARTAAPRPANSAAPARRTLR